MLKKYDKSFWVFITLMIIITTSIMIINNYTTVSVKELSEDADEHIAKIEAELIDIREELLQSGEILNQFIAAGHDAELLETEIATIEVALKQNNSLVDEAYYQAGDEAVSADYENWGKIKQAKSQWEHFVYAHPIYQDEQYLGELGVLVSYEEIQLRLEQEKGEESFRYAVFTNEKEAEEFYAEASRQKWVCTYKDLDAGMVYIEVHEKLKRTEYSNDMILLISIFAICAMWMIQRSKRTGKTIFDKISDYIMADYADRMPSTTRQGNQATIALNIGMSIAIFADVIYSIALGRDIKVLLEYSLFFVFSTGVVFLYKRSKAGVTERMATVIITLGFICSMAEHINTGGFYAGRAGESFLWFFICIYFGLFILGTKKGGHFFQVYVVFLFLDVVLETVMFMGNDYEQNYLFSASFILLGFALYIAIEIYVSGAAGHYNRTKELIDELKQNQKLLMQKEKMSALGQLISGVSYEINTPIGAIKASAETMDSLFLPMLEVMLEAAEKFSQEEYQAFVEVTVKTMEATKEMRNTGEIRRNKKEIANYFSKLNLGNPKQMSNLLGELEIVDLDWIQAHIAMLKMDGINAVLEQVTKLTAFTTGIPITIYSSDLVSQLVQALKSYVHIGEGVESLEFDVIQSIETVLTLFRSTLKGSVQVNKKYAQGQMRIVGNSSELSQVWTNLIQNSLQAMRGGGELTLEVWAKEDTVNVRIGDTGEGILPELLPQIFEPFFSTRNSGEGSGLGLNIARKIIEKHGGWLQVESQPGAGTEVTVCLKKGQV